METNKPKPISNALTEWSRRDLSPCPTDAALAVLEKFPQVEDFFNAYGVDMQERCASSPARCHFGKAPALSTIASAYGKAHTKRWLYVHVCNIVRFCAGNASKNVDLRQLHELSAMILTEYYWLNAAELCLFAHRFKCGRYGKFYKGFEPLTIMQGLAAFVKERQQAWAEHERKISAREIEQASETAVTYNEYRELCRRAKRGDADARRRIKQGEA